MKLTDLKSSLNDFWSEFSKIKFGIAGLILFGIFLFLMIFEPYVTSFPNASHKWRDISYWENNPSGVPPIWINLFVSKKRTVSTTLKPISKSEKKTGNLKIVTYVFEYPFDYYYSPTDLSLNFEGSGKQTIDFSVKRPDGYSINLLRQSKSLGSDGKIRISMAKDSKANVYNFFAKMDPESIANTNRDLIKPMNFLFAPFKNGNLSTDSKALNGKYTFTANFILLNSSDKIENVQTSVVGGVYGLLGTDTFKRDLWSGFVAGVKWALLIGLLTAFVSVGIGVIYGVMSAYLGGWKDSLMQRIYEIFVSIPMLPLLIVISAIFKPSIWTFILLMSALYWTGSVKTVRSIGLQIKEETYIEASKAIGASNSRIIFKHMIPLLIPYAFASMALFVPAAIVSEASVSLLGLGDATIVTWGQILHEALGNAAVMNGMWWWIIPPGFAIAAMGMTFAFIGFAMDKILHPKLRSR